MRSPRKNYATRIAHSAGRTCVTCERCRDGEDRSGRCAESLWERHTHNARIAEKKCGQPLGSLSFCPSLKSKYQEYPLGFPRSSTIYSLLHGSPVRNKFPFTCHVKSLPMDRP